MLMQSLYGKIEEKEKHMAKYLIVGGVAGGMSAATRLSRLDESARIIVIERGAYVSYANCGLPYYVGAAITERDRLLVQTPESFKNLFNIEVRTGNEVIRISPDNKRIRVKELESGLEYDESYDTLLLSPGVSPVKPSIPGSDHPAIHTLWTIPDSDRIREMVDAGKVKTALVVGAGFIGLEMAENLSRRGINVVVVEAAKQAMNAIDFEMAAIVHRELRMNKVALYLEDGIQAFENGKDESIVACLNSGRSITAELVLLSVGVRPNTGFLAGSGIDLGPRGHIVVDDRLKTNIEYIYATGDAIEVINPITKKKTAVPLAGPANKQGRIAADNMNGKRPRTYNGTMGTAIAKVFDLTVGMTGVTEKLCKLENMPHNSVIIHPNDFAGYYPGATRICLKLVFSPESRKVLGAQAIGYGGVDKRIDVIATAIKGSMTIDDLAEIEHAYAPPYSSAKDPVNMAGFVAQNILDGVLKSTTWEYLHNAEKSRHFLLDVRTPAEYAAGTIEGAVNIPLDMLRERITEIPGDKPIILFCRAGLTSYNAARILEGNGITNYANLSGGYETYQIATSRQDSTSESASSQSNEESSAIIPEIGEKSSKIKNVNACGLQCPGPVMRLKQEIDSIAEGDVIAITASDPGFLNDAASWARSTGNIIRDIKSEKGIVKAVIEKGREAQPQSLSRGNDKTLIVFSGDLDKAIASFIIANGALAMGRKVTMFFTFWGLNILRKPEKMGGVGKNFIEAAFGFMMPRGSRKLTLSKMSMGGVGGMLIREIMKNKNIPSLDEMISMALKGGAKVVACQMSMDLMGIRREELIDGVQIGGVASYLEASEHADNNLFI
jgi:NADPH-dependent 2,4-dienoyl-CoA reductase/sulfur reductase-like enzyme/peroxiredoxin family protein/rhodanese-related sulfurtransferase/TusA-related sulfurtransferase